MRRSAVPALAVLALVVLGVSGACSMNSAPAAHLDGLLILAGDTSGGALRLWSGGAGPDAGAAVKTTKGTTWVSAGRADVLIAALRNGTLRVSDPLGDRKPAWREPDAFGADGAAAKGPFYFPTWDPEGGRFAALAGDLDVDPRLTLVDPTLGTSLEIALDQPVAAAPPAWVGNDLLAVLTGTTDAPTTILVDTETSEIRAGPSGARLLATSPDGRTIAVVGDGGSVTIRPTDGWLAGDGSSIGSVDPPASAIAASSIALDARGERLAIAWLTDGGTVQVAVHDRTAEWRRVAEPSIGDAAGAVVAWTR